MASVRTWYELIRYTTYMQAVMKSCQFHFSVTELSAETVEYISQELKVQNTPGVYQRLWDKMHLQEVHTYHLFHTGPQFASTPVRFIPTVSQFCPLNRDDVHRIASESSCEIGSFDEFLAMMEHMYAAYAAAGVKAFKFGNAYARRLDIGGCDRQAAEEIFERIISGEEFSWETVKPLDDYIVHMGAQKAKEQQVPIVFHIALHAWNRNDPRFCHAEDLTDFIRMYPDVQIVILHSGIPYTKEALLLARYYPNVHVNMTWMHIISRRMSIEAMRDYIEFLPTSKVTAFGGDYGNPFLIAGHLMIAKENTAAVFASLIQEGLCSLEEAKRIAMQWFYENPKRLFAK